MPAKNTTILRTCQHCHKAFSAPLLRVLNGRGKFCGRVCYWTHRRGVTSETVADRFWGKVERIPDEDSCWLWLAYVAPDGYGAFGLRGRSPHAHRVAYELTYGAIPTGLHVLHRCDNPRCVRPDHLFLGTNIDNIRDMDAKSRRRVGVGERQALAKLTEAAVRDIRAQHATGKASVAQLAQLFEVHENTLRSVVQRKTWKHVT